MIKMLMCITASKYQLGLPLFLSNSVLIPILVPLESFRQAASLQQMIVETNVTIIVLTKLILLQLLIDFNDQKYPVWIICNRS